MSFFYHDYLGHRFKYLDIDYQHTHLRFGYHKLSAPVETVQTALLSKLRQLYHDLERIFMREPSFKTSMYPLTASSNCSMVNKMIQSTMDAGVGPMAAVAGAVSEEISKEALLFADEVIVENGGDVCIQCDHPLSVMIYPGWGKLPTGIIIDLPPGHWGLASSSGRYGPSLSFGEAEMVTVVSQSSTRADAFATAIANRIRPRCDPLKILNNYPFLKAVSIVWRGKLWYKGDFELRMQNIEKEMVQ